MKLNMNRREFLAAFGTIAASAVLAGCGGTKTAETAGVPSNAVSTPAPSGDDKSASLLYKNQSRQTLHRDP